MKEFKWRHFRGDIILGCVRWYCKYGISYRDLEEMMLERGVEVDHSTLYRWVIRYAPEIEKRMRWYSKPPFGCSWQVDETYVKVRGEWAYLYRAIDKCGNTIDFYLSKFRDVMAAKKFLKDALKKWSKKAHPKIINTDKAPAYGVAIKELKAEGYCYPDIQQRQVKYLNNRIESDHGKLKRLIKPTLGFKSMRSARATIKGFEVMRMFKKGQMNTFLRERNNLGEARLVNRLFGIYAA